MEFRCPPRSSRPRWRPSCCRSARAACSRGRRTPTRTCSRGRRSTSCDGAGSASRAARRCASSGDQKAVSVGAESALLVRGQDGELRAFANVCRHRGHELLPCGEARNARAVVCPYHAWGYGLDGRLKGAPNFRDVPGFDTARVPAVRARVRGVARVRLREHVRRRRPAARPARRPGPDRRAVRHRLAGHAGQPRLRRRGELEGAVGELQRVLSLHDHPPRAVPGEPAGQRLRLRRRGRLGRRVDVARRRRRDDVAGRQEPRGHDPRRGG